MVSCFFKIEEELGGGEVLKWQAQNLEHSSGGSPQTHARVLHQPVSLYVIYSLNFKISMQNKIK